MSNTTKLFDLCVADARKIINDRGHDLNPETQVKNIFAYAATDSKFASVIQSNANSPEAIELRAQIRYVCDLGLDTAKGRKLVYVKTRNVNLGEKNLPDWHTFPDIQESYHALIYLLVKAGSLKSISVLHTYENYPIEYSGEITDAPIVKAWEVPPSERGEYTGCFVVLTYPDGEIRTSYHHAQDIRMTHQKYSKSDRTWKNHEQAMIAKSAILDATRYIPVFDAVIAKVVEHYDQTMDYESAAISDEQALRIAALIEKTGIAESDILKFAGAENVLTIPESKYEAVINVIEAKAEAKQ